MAAGREPIDPEVVPVNDPSGPSSVPDPMPPGLQADDPPVASADEDPMEGEAPSS